MTLFALRIFIWIFSSSKLWRLMIQLIVTSLITSQPNLSSGHDNKKIAIKIPPNIDEIIYHQWGKIKIDRHQKIENAFTKRICN